MQEPKTVSASEAKNKFGTVMKWVIKEKNDVIVENRGKPRVAVISFNEYESIKKVKEEIKRRTALEQLKALQKRVSERNKDLTPKQADVLADRFSREIIEDMVKEGKIRFEK
ncbi:type II toxin-antitoxin system prevent-host-death family antitoxin [Candidatus Roizmanbacteria bacterium]|nr:type II toxin-antitoxin system prevent-host-death family antitoxin [Candidatus Roizmanbacteria bacterium]